MSQKDLKHGARALARLLRENQLDRRTRIGQQFFALQDALAEERGGWSNTTTGERVLFEIVASELLICRAVFHWAARQPSIVAEGAEGPQLLGPLAKGFTSHAAALTRAVTALGLKPEKVERLPNAAELLDDEEPAA